MLTFLTGVVSVIASDADQVARWKIEREREGKSNQIWVLLPETDDQLFFFSPSHNLKSVNNSNSSFLEPQCSEFLVG